MYTVSFSAVIEKFTKNTRFCLICNYVSKIIPALQSRCTRFRFPPLEEEYVRTRLSEICKEERYNSALLLSFSAAVGPVLPDWLESDGY